MDPIALRKNITEHLAEHDQAEAAWEEAWKKHNATLRTLTKRFKRLEQVLRRDLEQLADILEEEQGELSDEDEDGNEVQLSTEDQARADSLYEFLEHGFPDVQIVDWEPNSDEEPPAALSEDEATRFEDAVELLSD